MCVEIRVYRRLSINRLKAKQVLHLRRATYYRPLTIFLIQLHSNALYSHLARAQGKHYVYISMHNKILRTMRQYSVRNKTKLTPRQTSNFAAVTCPSYFVHLATLSRANCIWLKSNYITEQCTKLNCIDYIQDNPSILWYKFSQIYCLFFG